MNKKDIKINDEDTSSKFEKSLLNGGDGISDGEKIERLSERIKEYKNEKDIFEKLLGVLKEDNKKLKKKLTDFETFGGKIGDYNEFIRLFNIAVKNYKPKNKEQKEALEKLKENLKKELD